MEKYIKGVIMTYIEDTSKEIEKIAKKLIDTDFPDLSVCKIRYAWNETPKEDTEVMGTTTMFSKKIRDLFEIDFLIDINRDYWRNFDKIDKEKVVYHELCHCVVKKNKDNTIAFDKEDRVKIALKKHDIVLERFQSELDKYNQTYDNLINDRNNFTNQQQQLVDQWEKYIQWNLCFLWR